MSILRKILASKRLLTLSIWILIISASIIGGIGYYRHITLNPSTDDAYIQANIVQIAAQVTGPVNKIYVQDNQSVKAGQLLFSIDPKPFQYAVAAAKANLLLTQQKIAVLKDQVTEAQANLTKAQAYYTVALENAPRTLILANEGKVSKAAGVSAQGTLDEAKAAVTVAASQLQAAENNLGAEGKNNAALLAAKAQLKLAKLNLNHTKIYAPSDGILVNFSVRQGEMITTGQPLFALIETQQWWVTANYKETNLTRLRPGQKATIRVDIYPDHVFHGYVQSISYGSGAAFSLLPPEDATGNWVKVTQRFPVKIIITDLNSNYPLRIGASATVSVKT